MTNLLLCGLGTAKVYTIFTLGKRNIGKNFDTTSRLGISISQNFTSNVMSNTDFDEYFESACNKNRLDCFKVFYTIYIIIEDFD